MISEADNPTIRPHRTIWLIRHAHRQDVAEPSWVKQSPRPHDPPLSSLGYQQAQQLATSFAHKQVDHLFSSPFLRTMDTATPLAIQLKQSLKVERGLCEVLLEKWFPQRPTLFSDSILAKHYPQVDRSYRTLTRPRWPETDMAVLRASRAMQRILSHYNGNMALVTHGGIIAQLCAYLLGKPGQHPPIQTPYCCLIELQEHPTGWKLVRNGKEDSHLGAYRNG